MEQDLFAELKEGMNALAVEREGKATFPKLKAGKPEPVEVSSSPETLQVPNDIQCNAC